MSPTPPTQTLKPSADPTTDKPIPVAGNAIESMKRPLRSGAAISARGPKLRFEVDDRLGLQDLALPGPRRAAEKQGGSMPAIQRLQLLIRCPLLPALAAAIRPRGTGRKAALPDLFWVFVLVSHRVLESSDEARTTITTNWQVIAKEFYFEHHIALPTKPGYELPAWNSWRTNAIEDRAQQIDILLGWFTTISVPLALAIRASEGGRATQDPLLPTLYDCIAADGTVRDAPSSVTCTGTLPTSESGTTSEPAYRNSRARQDRGRPRVHREGTLSNKPRGAPKGFYNLTATFQAVDSYTTVVLGVELGQSGEGEIGPAMRLLRRVFHRTDGQFMTLLYDGAVTPISAHSLTQDFGVVTMNSQAARPVSAKMKKAGRGEGLETDFDADSKISGQGTNKFGVGKGTAKVTYVTKLPQVRCENGGKLHIHHLLADDGTIYESDLPVVKGMTTTRVQALEHTSAEKRHDHHGKIYYRLTAEGVCHEGGRFSTIVDLKAETNRDGGVDSRSPFANIRLVPDTTDRFTTLYGFRNQVESWFSVMDNMFFRHDRAASWGHIAQELDLIGAAMLTNTMAWAHLAARHPERATELARELLEIVENQLPDLSGVVKKPVEERKKALTEELHLHGTRALVTAERPTRSTAHSEEGMSPGRCVDPTPAESLTNSAAKPGQAAPLDPADNAAKRSEALDSTDSTNLIHVEQRSPEGSLAVQLARRNGRASGLQR